jgi:hypothetical protein
LLRRARFDCRPGRRRRFGFRHDRLAAAQPASRRGGGQFPHLPGRERLLDAAEVIDDLGRFGKDHAHQTISSTDARS